MKQSSLLLLILVCIILSSCTSSKEPVLFKTKNHIYYKGNYNHMEMRRLYKERRDSLKMAKN